MTCKSEDCDGTKYTGAFQRCQSCGVEHWWSESRIAYGVAKLPPSYTEQGWCATRAGEDVGMGYGPTKATALADLRQRVRLAEGLDAASGELRKLEKASGLDLSGWAPGVDMPPLNPPVPYTDSTLRCAPVPEEYGPDNLGVHEVELGFTKVVSDPGLRGTPYRDGLIVDGRIAKAVRARAWSNHKAIADGLTAFMQWVGEPTRVVLDSCDWCLGFGRHRTVGTTEKKTCSHCNGTGRRPS